ncbi:MAG: hypothetical protein ACR2NU_08120 [Aeoliella sp.]
MDDLIVNFCEDRRSWLVVIAGTLGLALVLVLPGVDEYLAVCDENAELTDQLATAELAAGQVGGYEKRVAEKEAVVKQALAKTLHQENVVEYRNSIVKLVRETGCQLRRLNINPPQARDWGEQDNPLDRQSDKKLRPSGFQLEKRVAQLSLAGSSANVRRLLERFEKQREQVHIHGIELRPGRGDGRRVELSLELWYFTLARAAA